MEIETSITVERPKDLSEDETDTLECFALIVALTRWFQKNGYDVDKAAEAAAGAVRAAWEEA